jgi:hypothetical protein
MVCLTNADVATLIAPLPGAVVDDMTSSAVKYHAGGVQTVVGLR